MPNSSQMELYAVSYGEADAPSDLIYFGDQSQSTVPVIFSFFVIRSDHGTTLIDTGFRDPAHRDVIR